MSKSWILGDGDRSNEPSPPHWHNVTTLDDGTRVGELGSLKYILDEDGRPLSDGYHEIREVEGGYVGAIGARRELLAVPISHD